MCVFSSAPIASLHREAKNKSCNTRLVAGRFGQGLSVGDRGGVSYYLPTQGDAQGTYAFWFRPGVPRKDMPKLGGNYYVSVFPPNLAMLARHPDRLHLITWLLDRARKKYGCIYPWCPFPASWDDGNWSNSDNVNSEKPLTQSCHFAISVDEEIG